MKSFCRSEPPTSYARFGATIRVTGEKSSRDLKFRSVRLAKAYTQTVLRIRKAKDVPAPSQRDLVA